LSQQPDVSVGAQRRPGEPPLLSVILPTCDDYSTIRLTVRALGRQTIRDRIELVIVAPIDDPVVYCEHKYLYYHLKADKLPDKGLPTGRARIAREGRDLTIVSYSAMTQESLAAAEELAREGLEVEVVDLRTVKPLDTDTVLASVARTGRLLCVGESFPWGGTTAEVIARVTSQGFHLLDAAPQRLNAKDTPIPYHPNLWSAHRPNAKNIVAKARALLRE